jgi:hypothetical protein
VWTARDGSPGIGVGGGDVVIGRWFGHLLIELFREWIRHSTGTRTGKR